VSESGLIALVERQLEVASLSGEVEAVMRGIVEHLMQLPGADGASLSSVDEDTAHFHVSLGMDEPLRGRTMPLASTLGARISAADDVQVLRAPPGEEVENGLTQGAAVIMLAPVVYDGEMHGILGVRSAEPGAFTQPEVVTARLLARAAAIALRNAELVEGLERSEREYRRLHDQASDAILVSDGEGRLLDANEEAASMLWYSVDELRGMHARDLFEAGELAATPPRLEKLLEHKQLRAERPFRRKDGTTILIEYSSRALDDGRVHTTLRDVTERRADEERLRTSLERLREIIATQREISELELDHEAVTVAIVERARRLAHADGAVVSMFVGEETVWRFASGIAAGHIGLRQPRSSSISGAAERLGETIYCEDTYKDPRSDTATARLVEMRSLICSPLQREGHAIGVLLVMTREPDAFDELAIETTRLMAEFVSTAMRNAEELEARQHLVERLRLQGEVVEHMQTALWVWTRESDGRLHLDYANAASEHATGLRPDEIVGHTVDEVLPARPGDLDAQLTAVLETGEPLDLGEIEYGDHRIRQSIFSMRVFPLPDDRIAVAFENVTDRVHARRALRESESRFRSAFHSSSIGMALTALDGRVVQINDRLADLLGYTPHEATRLRAKDALHPEEILIERTLSSELRRGERNSYTRELRLVRKDRSEVWARISVSLVRDYGGNPVHFVSHVEDVSERRALEQQLRQAQKMEAVGRLAGGIAHDFNNLLTAISGYTEFLIGGLDDERLRRHAEEIRRAAGRAASLTGQLLAFSRRQVLQPRVLDLNAVVSDMDVMLRRLIGEDIELAARLDPGIGAVRADPTQLEQVIINLAVNARDAMPQGGSLTIETSNVELEHAAFVELTLTDTGLGMTEEQRQRLFDPFFTTKEGGTGLGLATVYGIVEQSGGTIEVDSEPGLGTSFRIALPQVQGEAEVPADRHPAAAPRPGTETILLVEDEAVVRRLVAEILETNGYTVLQAGDGPSALELLRRRGSGVELLVTDVVMPGMSGREVAQSITSLSPGTQVLYMSGYTDQAIDHHGILEPGIAFLQKPFTSDELTRRVRALLDGVSAQA
jgi:two-component system cell cycle sensor histidine kinase/response regulator CckA